VFPHVLSAVGRTGRSHGSYDYSQRHHDTPWLLIDFGARAKQRVVLDREHFKLVSATGEWFPVASQRNFLDGSRDIYAGRALLRNAEGAWERGEYALLIEHPQARLKLPISLD
jgi:hypothetical protein